VVVDAGDSPAENSLQGLAGPLGFWQLRH
jgi:hypothetical protein